MYVLDASVVLKWFLQEKDTESALNLKQKYLARYYNLAFPDLILYELPNALRYNKSFSAHTAYEAIENLISLGVDIVVPTTSMIRNALEIAYKKNITFYDAAYVSLAQGLGYDFITADEKLYRRIKDLHFAKLLSQIA